MDRIRFIINPISGNRKNPEIEKLIIESIDASKFKAEFSYTNAVGHATELCREAMQDGIRYIVAVGGDGTINELAKVMINSEVVLGIIPVGSGNGLARHMGIPLNIKGAIQLINKKNISKIDTALVNNTPFISIAGVGFDALIAQEFKKSSKRGFLNYFRLSVKHYFNYKPEKYKLTFSDGTLLTERALLVCFANSNQFGYNTTIAPHAKLNDGKLDICIVKKPNIFQLPLIGSLLLLNKIDQSPLVQIIQSEGLTINREENNVVNIDGEAMNLKKKLVVKINPLSLSVFIP